MKVDNKEQKSYDHKKFMKPRGARLCVFICQILIINEVAVIKVTKETTNASDKVH